MAIGDGLTALVIDDDDAIRALISKVVSAHGFVVKSAADGLEALMQLEETTADIIICDSMMPNLDGISFLKAIKQRAATTNIPVIFVTAKTDLESIRQTIRAGAFFYLPKPFKRDDLVSKIKESLAAVDIATINAV
jgi:CheY-like chemotaxis protein